MAFLVDSGIHSCRIDDAHISVDMHGLNATTPGNWGLVSLSSFLLLPYWKRETQRRATLAAYYEIDGKFRELKEKYLPGPKYQSEHEHSAEVSHE